MVIFVVLFIFFLSLQGMEVSHSMKIEQYSIPTLKVLSARRYAQIFNKVPSENVDQKSLSQIQSYMNFDEETILEQLSVVYELGDQKQLEKGINFFKKKKLTPSFSIVEFMEDVYGKKGYKASAMQHYKNKIDFSGINQEISKLIKQIQDEVLPEYMKRRKKMRVRNQRYGIHCFLISVGFFFGVVQFYILYKLLNKHY